MTGIIIRLSEPSEWKKFRDFRLVALLESPGVGEAAWAANFASHGPQGTISS